MKKIVLAHDGSKPSEKALKKAIELAHRFNASVTVISVVPDLYLTELMETDRQRILKTLSEEARTMLEKVKTRAKGVKVRTIIRQGNPADEVIQAAREGKADLIVTGSHGRHGAQKFLLGSVSSKIVDHAPCDVLIVK